ncbi:hypothetical protein OY671_011550 [Metschnikowia pulcherrima]|nr:hypothetical protein OY671_011550 [Metschnikowia pulcherrima]
MSSDDTAFDRQNKPFINRANFPADACDAKPVNAPSNINRASPALTQLGLQDDNQFLFIQGQQGGIQVGRPTISTGKLSYRPVGEGASAIHRKIRFVVSFEDVPVVATSSIQSANSGGCL